MGVKDVHMLMRITHSILLLVLLSTVPALLLMSFPGNTRSQINQNYHLQWTIMNTPSVDNNFIVSPSEINIIAGGADDSTLYAIDIPYKKLYKSTNAGVTWKDTVMQGLDAAGAKLPVWNITIAPDDVNFVVAVTDGNAAPNGPKQIYTSTDGGVNWQSAGFPALPGDEYISCVAVSLPYSPEKRDVAIATRRGGVGTGRVFVMKVPGYGLWVDQTIAPSTNWVNGDVVALKFSPGYETDSGIIISYASAAGLFLNIGYHDIFANSTVWKTTDGYPRKIVALNGFSPSLNQVITADLQLPADFYADDIAGMRRSFLSYDSYDGAKYHSGIFRIDDHDVSPLQLDYSEELLKRFSTIAYTGTYDSGILHAGLAATDPAGCKAPVWRYPDPLSPSAMPERHSSEEISEGIKCPTGGVISGMANSRLLWNAVATELYCATASSQLNLGGTGWVPATWPRGLYEGKQALDESAFSVSMDNGLTWNQISLIDTAVTQFSDVAVLEQTENEPSSLRQHGVLYLSSLNSGGFDSIWRSITDPIGERWQRILCTATVNDSILRVNQRVSDMGERSAVLVYADRFTEDVKYSIDEGQTWMRLYPGIAVNDLSLAADATVYILDDTVVRKASFTGSVWQWSDKIRTGFEFSHSITTPLKNPSPREIVVEDWVIVGDALTGDVVFADFSTPFVSFGPSPNVRKLLPFRGNVHVACDEKFHINKTIYAAVNAAEGQIYRWVIGKSIEWEKLGPPDNDFYGIVHHGDVLYGAYNAPVIPNVIPGVDRTLYSRNRVPPSVEWDPLFTGLPDVTPLVRFTREPSSLKVTGNTINTLWSIDNALYDWGTKKGCLWMYTDSIAKIGPWTTAPPSNAVIPFDTVTGRTTEVNFAWRSLSYVSDYQVQIAKDDGFSLIVIDSGDITPADPLSPAWIVFPGPLESGHKYYWRARASRATSNEQIHSPWSATMHFTGMAGLPVIARHSGLVTLSPADCSCNIAEMPSFSWSPLPSITEYEFTMATNPAMTQVIEQSKVTATACQYLGRLDIGRTYYWRVRAISPMQSNYSSIASFTVGEKQDSETSSGGIPREIAVSLFVWIGIIEYALIGVSLILLIRFRGRAGTGD